MQTLEFDHNLFLLAMSCLVADALCRDVGPAVAGSLLL